jgi:iron complex outermembrane receptor protein
MRTANYALGLDKKSNNFARTKGASVSIENESAIKRESIKVIGIVPDQNPKSNTSVLEGKSLRLQQSNMLGRSNSRKGIRC